MDAAEHILTTKYDHVATIRTPKSSTYTLQTHIFTWGNPKNQPLILLHGFMQNGYCWNEIAKKLENNFYLVAPDLIGHGKTKIFCDNAILDLQKLSDECRKNSDLYCSNDNNCCFAAKKFFGFKAYVNQIIEVIKWIQRQIADSMYNQTKYDDCIIKKLNKYRLAKPIVYGYSMGGRIAELVSLHYSDMVFASIFESAGIGPKDIEEKQHYKIRTQEWIARLEKGSMEEFVNYWQTLPLFKSQQDLDTQKQMFIRTQRLNNDPFALSLSLRYAGQYKMPHLEKKLTHLDIPTLFLAGEKDKKYSNLIRHLSKEYLLNNDNATCAHYVIVGNAGHDIHEENPLEVCDIVTNFIYQIKDS